MGVSREDPAEAHCATCSCVPGMTPAVRFDTTPAEREGAVRDHLIRMGWTPPAEAQAQGGGEVVVTRAGTHDGPIIAVTRQDGEGRILSVIAEAAPPSAPVGVTPECLSALRSYQQADAEGVMVTVSRQALDEVIAALAQQPAPSAPVGVETLTEQFIAAFAADEAGEGSDPAAGLIGPAVSAWLRSLAQQPAAVDRVRFRKAPCYLCGYNGAGYFQPETHPCAAIYHAAQHQEPKS